MQSLVHQPISTHSLLAVRSTPDLQRHPPSIRPRSVDLSRHSLVHYPHLGQQKLHHSPSTTISKNMSSGSLSTYSNAPIHIHQGQPHHHGGAATISELYYPSTTTSGMVSYNNSTGNLHSLHAWQQAERASQRSESPLQLSPRTAGSMDGYHATHAEHHGPFDGPFTHPTHHLAQYQQQQQQLAHPYPYLPSHHHHHQHQHTVNHVSAPLQQAPPYPPGSIIDSTSGTHAVMTHVNPLATMPLSGPPPHDTVSIGYIPTHMAGPVNAVPSATTHNVAPVAPAPSAGVAIAGAMNDMLVPETPPDGMTMLHPGSLDRHSSGGGHHRFVPGTLDLSTITREDTPRLHFALSGSATPHNWHHSYPPSDAIVTLSPGSTEIAWFLGLGHRVAAVSDTCDYPPDATTRAKAVRTIAFSVVGGGSATTSATQSPVKTSGSGNGGAAESKALQQAYQGGIHSNTGGYHAAAPSARSQHGFEALPPPFPLKIDEQVLARERPGLLVFEDSCTTDAISHSATYTDSASIVSAATTMSFAGDDLLEKSSIGAAILQAIVSVGLQQSCRVVCLRCTTLNDVLSSMLTVGEAAGVKDEADKVVDKLRARLRRIAGEAARATMLSFHSARGSDGTSTAATNGGASTAASSSLAHPDGSQHVKVLVLRSLRPIVAEGLWATDMITLAGGDAGCIQSGDPPLLLKWDEVVRFAPDVLLIAGMHDGNCTRIFHDLCTVAGMPGWWLLPAVRAGAVFVCEEALTRRAGPRLVDGVESIARMIHGDAVSVCCPPRAVLKLSLRPGQRCRPRLLPNYFMAYC